MPSARARRANRFPSIGIVIANRRSLFPAGGSRYPTGVSRVAMQAPLSCHRGMTPRARFRLVAYLPFILIIYMALGGAARAAEGEVVLLTVDGAISPATADYAVRGIRKAARGGAQLVVIQLDTPGGLDTSMRQLVKEILAAPIPVATFVAPSGARAASAGTFIQIGR